MTPSLKQRLGLAPVQLPSQERQMLLGARVGSVLFALEAILVLGATFIGGIDPSDTILFLAAGAGFALAIVPLLLYERLGAIGSHLVALTANAIVTMLVLGSELGPVYGLLYVWLALYVAFFMPRRQSAFQVAAIACSSGSALLATLPAGQALELWFLSSGILVGTVAFTSLLRDY
ncbi:MAG: hypothetical protein ACXWZB_07975, partial [Gaiellaceae bacterium]